MGSCLYIINKNKKFIFRNFVKRAKYAFIFIIFTAHLTKGGQNVIVVDWREIANWSYVSTANYVKPVSKVIAKFIDCLHSIGLNCANLKLIGHSLGAHVMGLGGRQAKCNIGYILG